MDQKFEPKQYTPEEIAKMEKSRTLSDAELLKGGAEYEINENGEKQLAIDLKDINRIHNEHEIRMPDSTYGIYGFEGQSGQILLETLQKYVLEDIVSFIREKKKELRYSNPDSYKLFIHFIFDPSNDAKVFMESLQIKFVEEIAKSNIDDRTKLDIVKYADSGENIFSCGGCLKIYLSKVGPEDLFED